MDRTWTQSVSLTLSESVQRYHVRYTTVNSCHCCLCTAAAGHHPRECVCGVWARVCGVSVMEAARWDQAASTRVAHPVGRHSERSGCWGGSWLVKKQLGGRGGGGAVGQKAIEEQLVVVWGWSSSRCCHHHVVMLMIVALKKREEVQLWQVTGGVVVWPVILDKWGDRGDVAGVHRWHAGGTVHRRGLVVQVQHSDGRHRGGGSEMRREKAT